MHSKCVECGGKIDCDDIICANCLADIINKLYFNNQGIPKKGRGKGHDINNSIDYKPVKRLTA